MITSFFSIHKKDIRLTALAQLQQCKEQLRALETYNAAEKEISSSLWVSKKAVETAEQCQIFYQALEQLSVLVSKTILPASTAGEERNVDKRSETKVSPC